MENLNFVIFVFAIVVLNVWFVYAITKAVSKYLKTSREASTDYIVKVFKTNIDYLAGLNNNLTEELAEIKEILLKLTNGTDIDSKSSNKSK